MNLEERYQQIQLDALKLRINVLKKGMGSCAKSKDPVICKSKLMKKINKLEKKAHSLSK